MRDISSIPVSTSPVVTDTDEMYVTKRNGKLEIISFDKILKRIKNVGKILNVSVNFSMLAMKVIDQLHDKIETTKIDELTAEQCIMLSTSHPDYGLQQVIYRLVITIRLPLNSLKML